MYNNKQFIKQPMFEISVLRGSEYMTDKLYYMSQ